MGEHTLRNAVIGAVVPVFLFFLPFAAVLGGGLAGYLEGGSTREGAWVGLLSGVIALLPFVGVLLLAATALPFLPLELAGIGLLVGVAVFVAAAVYLLGAGALGGAAGAFLAREL